MASTTSEVIYSYITGEDPEARACDDIPDEACSEVPTSFALNVLNGTCTKLAEQLASPGLVLPWLLASLGAPVALSGWLVPVRQAGSLVPQLVVADALRGFPRRKWFWVAAGVFQATMLLLMAVAAATLPPAAAGAAIVVLLALFSVASGVGSVAFSDVVGKTVPRGRRGRMLALRASLGGGLALIAGLVMRAYLGGDVSLAPLLLLLVAAAGLWIAGAGFFALIPEPAGVTGGRSNGLRAALRQMTLLVREAALRRFVIARLLLLSVELTMPYLTLYARSRPGVDAQDLGTFVIAVSIAAVVSSPLWGRFSDLASNRVMAAGAVIGAVAVTVAVALDRAPVDLRSAELYAVVFVILGLAEGGVRLGRKTYLVDMAPAGEKGTYKALTNTVVGVVMLVAGGLGAVAQAVGVELFLGGLGAMMLAGAILSWRLPPPAEG
jgi:MFS family permease